MACHQVLHFASRQPVPGDVNHIVSAAHDVDEAIVIQIPAVAGVVVARIGLQISLQIALMITPQGLAATGWQR
ncbi:hypothetical protein D3C76_1583430 [compost metagenome]